jgi:hypothetical protein
MMTFNKAEREAMRAKLNGFGLMAFAEGLTARDLNAIGLETDWVRTTTDEQLDDDDALLMAVQAMAADGRVHGDGLADKARAAYARRHRCRFAGDQVVYTVIVPGVTGRMLADRWQSIRTDYPEAVSQRWWTTRWGRAARLDVVCTEMISDERAVALRTAMRIFR